MSITPVRFHTPGSLAGSGTTISATVLTANVAAGNVLVAWLGFKSLTSTTPTVSSISKMAGETNSWVKLVSFDGAVRGEMWAIRTTVAWTVGTSVTATLSAATTSKIFQLGEFAGASVNIRGVAGTGYSTGGTPTASTSGAAVVAGDLVLGGLVGSTSSLSVRDATGAWSATGSGGLAGNNSLDTAFAFQYAAFTATGAQTYDPTFTGTVYGSGAVVVALMPQNSAPNAPTLNTPATGTTIDLAVTNRFGLTFSDPDVGDSLSKLDLRYKLVGAGSWTTVTQSLPNAFYDFAPATFVAGNYEWQACTYDHLGLVGPYCASSFFTAASTPGVPSITTPTSGSTISTTTATVTWSTSTQTDYQIRRMDDVAGAAGTTVYYDSGDVVDTLTRSVVLACATNNRWEHIQVRVKAAGLWSTWADCRVQVSWTAPMVPTLTATAFNQYAEIDVTITNPTPTGGEPTVSYNDIYVSSPLDPEDRLATLIPPNSTWIWRTPCGLRAYTIRAVAVGTNGTTATSDDMVVIDGGAPTFTTGITIDGGTP